VSGNSIGSHLNRSSYHSWIKVSSNDKQCDYTSHELTSMSKPVVLRTWLRKFCGKSSRKIIRPNIAVCWHNHGIIVEGNVRERGREQGECDRGPCGDLWFSARSFISHSACLRFHRNCLIQRLSVMKQQNEVPFTRLLRR
jgi:hypothetical protein